MQRLSVISHARTPHHKIVPAHGDIVHCTQCLLQHSSKRGGDQEPLLTP